jgi:penicillin-binding protein 1A
VKAIVGGRNYVESKFNRATQADRQSGSSFKPYVFLAALLEGRKPTDIMVDGPVSIGTWSPGNYKDKYNGATTLSTALAKSFNSIPVKLLKEMGVREGVKKITELAHRVGVQGELDTYPTMVIGTSAITLLDLSTGYATFAAGGKLARPHAVLEIRRANGDLIYERAKKVGPAPQVVPEDAIADLNGMMGQVVKAGTARSADLEIMPAAGKTGTNQAYRDAWFIGYTAHNVTGVWVGNDDNTSMNDITGGRIPAPAWKQIMTVAEDGMAPEGFAGMPLDESYALAAAELAKKKAEEAVVLSADGSEAVPNLVPSVTEEAPAATPEQAAEADANDVLKGMFNLFEPEKKRKIINAQANTRKQRTRKQRAQVAASEGGYQVPKANAATERRGSTKRTFFERLFGTKKKKKTLYEF